MRLDLGENRSFASSMSKKVLLRFRFEAWMGSGVAWRAGTDELELAAMAEEEQYARGSACSRRKREMETEGVLGGSGPRLEVAAGRSGARACAAR